MQTGFCWVIQLFSLVCTVKGYYDREWRGWRLGRVWGSPCSWALSLTLAGACLAAKEMMGRDQDCLLPVEEAGIIWDSICFFFLLLQRRVFLSYYYLHVRADLQATALLASRQALAQTPPRAPVLGLGGGNGRDLAVSGPSLWRTGSTPLGHGHVI